jgi:peptidoglycan/LPS O-acetylase OafA/YrhL
MHLTETSTKANQSGYFPYIDGLRAVSIIAVVLFHLDARLLPGGFAGVDIFFVVSGFIISTSLQDRSFAGPLELFLFFYTRRFRRIVPAMLVMLAATCVAVVVFIPEALLSDPIARTGIAAFYGFSNIRLAFGTNYFFRSPNSIRLPILGRLQLKSSSTSCFLCCSLC